MQFVQLDHLASRNVPGSCHLDIIPIADVLYMPQESGGHITNALGLLPNRTWYRVRTSAPGTRLIEKWLSVAGSPVSDCSVEGWVPKDELWKLQALWDLSTTRFLVRFSGLNGDTLLVGTKLAGAQARVTERDRGDEADPVNGYKLTFRWRRGQPVPFYGPGTTDPPPPENCPSGIVRDHLGNIIAYVPSGGEVTLPAPDACPTLAELVAALGSMIELIAVMNPEQLAEMRLLICDCEDWDIIDGGGAVPVDGDVEGGEEGEEGGDPEESGFTSGFSAGFR